MKHISPLIQTHTWEYTTLKLHMVATCSHHPSLSCVVLAYTMLGHTLVQQATPERATVQASLF